MSNSSPPKPRSAAPGDRPTTDPRAARLKAALKANIAKRKAQARARDGQPDLPDADEAAE